MGPLRPYLIAVLWSLPIAAIWWGITHSLFVGLGTVLFAPIAVAGKKPDTKALDLIGPVGFIALVLAVLNLYTRAR